MRLLGILCFGALLAANLGIVEAQGVNAAFDPTKVAIKDNKKETKEEKDKRMAWWREARFGIFVHWGVYSIPAGYWNGKSHHTCSEWLMSTEKVPASEYRKFSASFNPTNFDANKWMKAISGSGAKYMVFTSKHHDGFAMYDSQISKYDIMDYSPFKRDIMKELAEACRANGMRFCTYLTILEWDNPTLGFLPSENKEKFKPFLKAQIGEILRDYKSDIMWFDGEWEGWWTQQDGEEIYDYIRSIEPKTIVNNRLTKARRNMYGLNKEGMFGCDYGTPEQEVPARGFPGVDWEACMTMNRSWGFHKTDTDWKSSTRLIQYLCEIVSKGGNFLLNVGPDSKGNIPEATLERLADIGVWMKTNGDAIYGTQASPFLSLPWGVVTQKEEGNEKKLYLMVNVSGKGKIPSKILLPMTGKDIQVKALKDGKECPVSESGKGEGLFVDLTGITADKGMTVFCLTGKDFTIYDALIPRHEGFIAGTVDDLKSRDWEIEFDQVGGGYDIVGSGATRTTIVKNFGKPEQKLTWQVLATEPGEYEAEFIYDCLPKNVGGEIALSLNGKKGLSHKVIGLEPKKNKEGNIDPKSIEVKAKMGKFILQKGLNELELSVTKTNGKSSVANIRGFVLKKVQ